MSGAKYDYDKAKWFNGEHSKKIDSNILINENKDEIIKGLSNEINEESILELINLVRERVEFKFRINQNKAKVESLKLWEWVLPKNKIEKEHNNNVKIACPA